MIHRIFLLTAVVGVIGLMTCVPAFADDDDLRAVPFAFVGAAGDCGVGYAAGSNIVTAAWLRGMGLPDNGGPNSNPVDPRDNPNKTDPHLGLLLSKNGPTADCSASGAEIKGFRGLRQGTSMSIVLGFDYRNGGHCGAGAPRFNVVARPATGPDTFHFVGGCSNGSPTAAGQDPTQWTQVRFDTADPTQSFPVIPAGSRIRSIDLIFDEGTDTANNDTEGVGLAIVDNIFINGAFIRSGEGIAPGDKDRHDDD